MQNGWGRLMSKARRWVRRIKAGTNVENGRVSLGKVYEVSGRGYITDNRGVTMKPSLWGHGMAYWEFVSNPNPPKARRWIKRIHGGVWVDNGKVCIGGVYELFSDGDIQDDCSVRCRPILDNFSAWIFVSNPNEPEESKVSNTTGQYIIISVSPDVDYAGKSFPKPLGNIKCYGSYEEATEAAELTLGVQWETKVLVFKAEAVVERVDPVTVTKL